MNLHRLAEERSLEYHREVARRIPGDPRIVDNARALLETWIERGGRATTALLRWRDVLSRPPADILATLADDREEARELRQSSPFAGALSPRERWRIWREVRERYPELR